jgi:hypothetical protein
VALSKGKDGKAPFITRRGVAFNQIKKIID